MEDSVTEAENLLNPVNLSPRSQAKEENHEELGKTNHGGGEERARGFINHLISNSVSGGEADEEKDDKDQHEKEQRGKDEVKRDGLLGHLISNLVSPKAGGINEGEAKDKEKANEEEMVKVVVENEQGKTVEKGGGVGGIIDNIVSHLPTSLPDDAAPTTDEAAILIHSIIHD